MGAIKLRRAVFLSRSLLFLLLDCLLAERKGRRGRDRRGKRERGEGRRTGIQGQGEPQALMCLGRDE